MASLDEAVLFFREGMDVGSQVKNLESIGHREIVCSHDTFDRALPPDEIPAGASILLPRLGVALLRAESDELQQLRKLSQHGGAVQEAIIAEDFDLAESSEAPVALDEGRPEVSTSNKYLQGYRDAVNHLAEIGGIAPESEFRTASGNQDRDDARGTWGLHATGVLKSRFTGAAVRVGALVDGLDATHPDWIGRSVVIKSFVAGEPPSVHGPSGTHYLGTALGPAVPSAGPRYGCAPNAEAYVAKVFDRRGSGRRVSIFAGLEWMIASGCRIVLAPLGWGGPAHDTIFERLAIRAARSGVFLVAGTGNNARRTQDYGYVVNPAACPSVMGVGSVDARLKMPMWHPRSSISGGKVDIVAPAVNLRSTLPRPKMYGVFSGSATAASYVAGIAALWAESRSNARPQELRECLIAHSRQLPEITADVGAGIVQAPQSDGRIRSKPVEFVQCWGQ